MGKALATIAVIAGTAALIATGLGAAATAGLIGTTVGGATTVAGISTATLTAVATTASIPSLMNSTQLSGVKPYDPAEWSSDRQAGLPVDRHRLFQRGRRGDFGARYESLLWVGMALCGKLVFGGTRPGTDCKARKRGISKLDTRSSRMLSGCASALLRNIGRLRTAYDRRIR